MRDIMLFLSMTVQPQRSRRTAAAAASDVNKRQFPMRLINGMAVMNVSRAAHSTAIRILMWAPGAAINIMVLALIQH
ncbi:hypothetical protein AWI71_15100 [Listeria monocytogenes]|nr:hypothetical protein AWI71_15100 [Listeria monocytogenes]